MHSYWIFAIHRRPLAISRPLLGTSIAGGIVEKIKRGDYESYQPNIGTTNPRNFKKKMRQYIPKLCKFSTHRIPQPFPRPLYTCNRYWSCWKNYLLSFISCQLNNATLTRRNSKRCAFWSLIAFHRTFCDPQ